MYSQIDSLLKNTIRGEKTTMAFKTEAQRCKGFSGLFAPVPTYQIPTPFNVLQERENNNNKKNIPVSFEKKVAKK